MTAPKKKPDGAKRKQSDLEEEREEMRRELRRELHAEMERQAALPAQAKKPSRKNRQLVRWDVDIDILLLLAIQYACNLTGTKIPWKEVCEVMGPKFTEGACTQHLAKVRTRREQQKKPVPPPLKRAAGSVNKNGTVNGGARRKTLESSPVSDLPLRTTRRRTAAATSANSSWEGSEKEVGLPKRKTPVHRPDDNNDAAYARKLKQEKKKRGAARRPAIPSDGEDNIYTVKKKAQKRAEQKGYPTDLFHAANMKPDPPGSRGKVVQAKSPWLQEFEDDEIETTDVSIKSQDDDTWSNESDTSDSSTQQSTTKRAKKPKVLASKYEPEQSFSVETEETGYFNAAGLPVPATPTQSPRPVIHGGIQRRGMQDLADNQHFSYMMSSGLPDDISNAFPGGYQFYPSSAPSPFDIVNQTVHNQTQATQAQMTQAMAPTDYNFINSYPQVEIPTELLRRDMLNGQVFYQNGGYAPNYDAGYIDPSLLNSNMPHSQKELFPASTVNDEDPQVKIEGDATDPNYPPIDQELRDLLDSKREQL